MGNKLIKQQPPVQQGRGRVDREEFSVMERDLSCELLQEGQEFELPGQPLLGMFLKFSLPKFLTGLWSFE